MGFVGWRGQATALRCRVIDSHANLNEQIIWALLASTFHLFSFHVVQSFGYQAKLINSALLKTVECINRNGQQFGEADLLSAVTGKLTQCTVGQVM